MHRNLSLCSSIDSKRARGEENAKQTLDARARKHREEEEEEEEKNNDDAPVYCSTSDFTHPSNPSSNVSKNAAPSTSRLALDADADDANAATVVAHAIVFFKPQYVLFFLPPPPMMMMMMICHVRVRFYI